MMTIDHNGKVIYKPDKKDHSALILCIALVAPVVIGLLIIAVALGN